MLYVLQRRDARGQNLSPQAVRGVVGLLAALPSIALAGEAFPDSAHAGYEGTVTLLKGVRWDIATGFDQFRGVDPARKLVWDLRTVSQTIPSLKKTENALRNPSSLDFGEIRNGWLRELVMHWARTTNPNSKDLREHHWACVIASRALELRPGGGNDPGKLQFSDVTAVVDAFRGACSRGGYAYAATTRIRRAAQFFDLRLNHPAVANDGTHGAQGGDVSTRIAPDEQQVGVEPGTQSAGAVDQPAGRAVRPVAEA